MARRAKGEGGLYQAKDKSWIYQYRVDGQRKSKRFKRKSDALAYMKAMAAGGPAQSPEESEMPAPPVQEALPAAPAKARQAKAKPEGASTGAAHAVGRVTPAVFQHMTPQALGVSEIITLGDWMDRWLEDYARPTVKLSTYSSYEMYIRRHIKPNIGGLYMSSIRVDDMQAFFNERGKQGNLVSGEGLSPKTLLNMRNMMHLAFTQAIRNKLAFDNPIEGVRIPKLVKTEMRVLTREEQDRLITATRFAPEPAAFGIVFDIFTGLRLGELCGLRWENVDMGNRSFTVCETRNRLPNHDPTIAASTSVKTEATTKTENSRRTVYLIDSLYQDFVMYKQIQDSITQETPGYNPDGYVFCQPCGRPYEPRTYQDLFKRCVKQAGIRDANFHALRHTFATRSLEEGMDVVTLSRILGHATPSITMDKYGHSTDEQKLSSMQKLDGLYARTYPDARTKMFTTLKEGALWWNYIGHASTQNWTGEGLLMRSDVETQLYYRHLPVLYAATCEYTRFDNTVISSGERIFLNANGGAVAVICPARLAYISSNGALSSSMGGYVFSPDEQGKPRRIGDIVRLAKNSLRGKSTDDNHRRFFCFGDPAMRLAWAPYRAQIETINGEPVDPDNLPVFGAREQVEFGGKIVDLKGELATNFDGTVISTLFAPEDSVTTHGYGDMGGVGYKYAERSNRLAINVDTVQGGRFTVRLIIPSEVHSNDDDYSPSMINLYAYDRRDSLEAKGSNGDFIINGFAEEEVADTIGPSIITMGLNDNSFVDGSDINDSPLLLATVADESGVNFSSSGIGHTMTLTLDGTTTFNDLVSYYTPQFTNHGTLGNISYQLSDLAPGLHSLRLRVWDVYNNVGEKTITFNVVNGLAPEIADVYCAANPASVETSFYVKHNRPDAVMTVTIEVYDLMGRMVWSTTQAGRSDMYTSTPVTWDLTDSGGRRVPRGIYVYRATITTDGIKEATKAKKLAVTGL